ncbi:hypothetical protein P7D93_17700 [Enterococcus raffinosus]|uniref:hypothetical protein n=1 Tax=Enterococcus raffinosus TaxID=71452 RepID=UPI00288CF071|nr:hypothetical protein [Enterococcus raffinosus]MDT2531726.1 hypothetical protein [Enterococcus raffinosus]
MAKYEFSVRYAGEALVDGRIPIRDLAPSLLALSEAFQEIQQITHPYQQPVSLDIKASEKGSFIVDLILANGNDLLSSTIDLLNGNESEALRNLIELATGFTAAVIFITKVGKKKIKRKKELPEGEVKITLDDETSITVSKDVFEAYRNVEFRKTTKEFVRPLESEGIEAIEFSTEKNASVSISKQDVSAFDVPEIEDKEFPSTESTVYLQIINISFANEKWKLTDGNKPFWAKIEDEEFLTSIENNQQQFGASDALKVILETQQKFTDNGLKTEYSVKKVIEHIKGPKQLKLDFEE